MAATPSGKDKLMRHVRLYHGGYDLSGDSRAFSEAVSRYEEVDIDGWSDSVRPYRPGRGSLGISGYQAAMNNASGKSWSQLSTAGDAAFVSMCFGGGGAPAAGDPAYLIGARQMGNPITLSNGLAVVTAEFAVDDGQFDSYAAQPHGWILQPDTSLSVTTNGTSIDMGAAASNGAQALLHIITSSGGTWAFKVQDSSDDAAWADLITFSSDGSSVTAERGTVAGSVDRYVRFVATRTSGTVTAVCTFSAP